MDIVEKQKMFCTKWEERRKRKWRFIFLQAIPWCIIFTVFIPLSRSHYKIQDISLKMVIISLLISGLGGILMGLRQFTETERRYLVFKEELEKEALEEDLDII